MKWKDFSRLVAPQHYAGVESFLKTLEQVEDCSQHDCIKPYADTIIEVMRSVFRATNSVLGSGTVNIIRDDGGPDIHVSDAFYTHYTIRKSGGRRRHIIFLSSDDVGPIQKGLLDSHSYIREFTEKFIPYHKVYSYRKGCSIRDCAVEHIGKRVIVGMDFADYFYSIGDSVVAKLLCALLVRAWFNEDDSVAEATDWDMVIEEVNKFTTLHSGKSIPPTYPISHAAVLMAAAITVKSPISEGWVLPIGITPSPAIANLILLPLDRELDIFTREHEISYNRYCDNVYLSSDKWIQPELIEEIIQKIEAYDVFGKFIRVNRKKTRILPHHKRQRVLGVVVNQLPNVPKERRRRVRSMLNHVFHDLRSADKMDKELRKRYRELLGELSFMKVVNPALAEKYEVAKVALQLARINIEEQMNRDE